MPINDKQLSRLHYKRLRWYFQGSPSRGAPSATDSIDLDLSAADLISRRDSAYTGTVFYKITDLGEKELAAEKEREIARRRPHHDLASRLAFWLQESGRITWENIEIGRASGRESVFQSV